MFDKWKTTISTLLHFNIPLTEDNMKYFENILDKEYEQGAFDKENQIMSDMGFKSNWRENNDY